jgi:hypothetical protein
MKLTFVIPDPPPTREDPGSSANRRSPNAGPLARAGDAVVAQDPGSFPLVFRSVSVEFGKTLPDVDPLGYQPDHPIIGVLSSVGAVIDPDSYTSSHSQDPSAEYYVVTFEG